jgi:hypothetical protein
VRAPRARRALAGPRRRLGSARPPPPSGRSPSGSRARRLSRCRMRAALARLTRARSARRLRSPA